MLVWLKNVNWKNIVSNFGAVYLFAKGVYPAMDAATIMASVYSGAIFFHLGDLALAYMSFTYGKTPTKIIYEKDLPEIKTIN